MNDSDFVEIVPAMDQADADGEFEAWLRERGIRASDIPRDDIRIDLIRSADGRTLKRYRMRRVTAAEADA